MTFSLSPTFAESDAYFKILEYDIQYTKISSKKKSIITIFVVVQVLLFLSTIFQKELVWLNFHLFTRQRKLKDKTDLKSLK